MDPLTIGAIAAPIVGGLLGFAGSQQTNNMSADASKDMWYWNRDLANTAHQREVADLKAAGLNPILSASGAGSAVPSAGLPAFQDLGKPVASAISAGMDTAIAIRGQNKQLEVQDADIGLKHDQAKTLASDRSVNVTKQQASNWQVQQEKIKTDILKKTADAAIKEAKAKGDFAQVNQLMGVIGAGASTAADVKDLFNPASGIIKVNKKEK